MAKQKKNSIRMKTKNTAVQDQIEKRNQTKAIYTMMKDFASNMLKVKNLEKNKEVYDVFKTIDEYEVKNVDQMSAVEMAQVQALYIKSFTILNNAANKEKGEENNAG